jgi:protein-S-isoprenylcysteine O-methyltransferase Ste14
MPAKPSLKFRLIRRGLRLQLGVAAMVFIPAWSAHYWQGWAYLGLGLLLQFWLVVYFYRHDPQVLERRLLTREQNREQKGIIFLLRLVVVSTLVISSLDHRHGWTAAGCLPVPAWLTVVALLVIAGGQYWFIQVLQANRFAASIIQIQTGQTIATTGPYRLVRHPMYLSMILHWLAAPLALGSLAGLAASVFVIPIFMLRLHNEEKMLRRELPGYAAYCQQTRCRLLPFVW